MKQVIDLKLNYLETRSLLGLLSMDIENHKKLIEKVCISIEKIDNPKFDQIINDFFDVLNYHKICEENARKNKIILVQESINKSSSD